MPSSKFFCIECEAPFKVSHSLDEKYYEVMFCPFCGAGIDDEKNDDEDEDTY